MNDPTGATRFARIRAHLESVRVAAGPRAWAYEFLLFGFKQGWACLFGGLMLALLLATTREPLAQSLILLSVATTLSSMWMGKGMGDCVWRS